MFSKNLAKKVLSVTGAIAIMASLAVPVVLAAPSEGKTTVYYTSEHIVPGPDNAKWGVKIPATVTLTNYLTEAPGKLDLVSMVHGKDLNDLYTGLEVDTTVVSANEFQFVPSPAGTGSRVGKYEYRVDGAVVQNNGKIPTKLSLAQRSHNGSFVLTEQVSAEGNYMDTVTFKFSQTAGTLKPGA